MKKEETKKILSILMGNYSEASKKFTQEDIQLKLNVYHEFLKDYDYEIALKGTMAYIRVDKTSFFPTVGQIIDSITNVAISNDVSDMAAWDMVRKAICDSTYHSQERFDEFPEDVKKAVGSPSQLRAWATDMSYAEGVAQSNFLRVYKSVLERKKYEFKLFPNQTKLVENKNQETKLIEEN